MIALFPYHTHINTVYARSVCTDTSRPAQVACTKAVYGVRVDTHDEHRMASFFEVGFQGFSISLSVVYCCTFQT